MFFPTTLDNARALYPEAFDAAVVVLRQSRSKRNREPLVTLEWGFEAAVSAPSVRIGDVVSGAAVQRREAFDALSIDEKLRDYEARCAVTIVGKFYGRVCLQSERLERVPAVVLDHQRRHLLAQDAEKRRIAALTPQARESPL